MACRTPLVHRVLHSPSIPSLVSCYFVVSELFGIWFIISVFVWLLCTLRAGRFGKSQTRLSNWVCRRWNRHCLCSSSGHSAISLQQHFSPSLKRNTRTLRCFWLIRARKGMCGLSWLSSLLHCDSICCCELEADQTVDFHTVSQTCDCLSLLFLSRSLVAERPSIASIRKYCDQYCYSSQLHEHGNCRNCERGTERCEIQSIETIAFRCYCVYCVSIRENPWKQIEDRSSTATASLVILLRMLPINPSWSGIGSWIAIALA